MRVRRELIRVDIVGHAVLLVGDHVGGTDSGSGGRRRRRSDGGSGGGHDVGLLSGGDEHGDHACGGQVLLWMLLVRGGGRVVVAAGDEGLVLVAGLEGLEGGRVDGALGDVGERGASGDLARVGGLAGVLIEGGGGIAGGCGAVDVGGDLLVEGLLFLLLGRVEVERRRRFDSGDIDVLLGTRLVHGQLALRPVLAEGWLLGRRVRAVGG